MKTCIKHSTTTMITARLLRDTTRTIIWGRAAVRSESSSSRKNVDLRPPLQLQLQRRLLKTIHWDHTDPMQRSIWSLIQEKRMKTHTMCRILNSSHWDPMAIKPLFSLKFLGRYKCSICSTLSPPLWYLPVHGAILLLLYKNTISLIYSCQRIMRNYRDSGAWHQCRRAGNEAYPSLQSCVTILASSLARRELTAPHAREGQGRKEAAYVFAWQKLSSTRHVPRTRNVDGKVTNTECLFSSYPWSCFVQLFYIAKAPFPHSASFFGRKSPWHALKH